MNVVTHLLAGWTLTLPADLTRRDRALIVLAAAAPDIDGIGLVGDLAAGRAADSLALWSSWHHVIGHNLLFAAIASALCILAARRRLAVGGLAFLALHLHLLADVAGARGPDGDQWPIPYLLPFSRSWQLAVDWQWELNAWPNVAITLGLLLLTLVVAVRRGISPVGLLSPRADRTLVETLRGRFGPPAGRAGR